MNEGRKFSTDLTELVIATKGRAHLVVRKVGLALYTETIMATPVDTGRARGGWTFSIGAPSTVAPLQTDKDGGQTVAAVTNQMPEKPAGLSMFLTNNVAYIRYLEYGGEIGANGSPQAPNGMVRVTVRNFQVALDRALAEARRR